MKIFRLFKIFKLKQMETKTKTIIKIHTEVNVPVEKVWKYWISAEDIIHWNHASIDWHTPKAANDFRIGGSFNFRMEAKDGSMGFDFGGVYDKIVLLKQIEYTLGDGRKVKIQFTTESGKTKISESFEAENENPVEMQRNGWQSILDNFKKYAEEKN
jgi:uncharacterized protein YndB with AHSA1/START domain